MTRTVRGRLNELDLGWDSQMLSLMVLPHWHRYDTSSPARIDAFTWLVLHGTGPIGHDQVLLLPIDRGRWQVITGDGIHWV
jgi:hypothetical protein